MTIVIEPRNKEVSNCEFPNDFWPAFCVETPASEVFRASYKKGTGKTIIVYFHDGYIGSWVTENEALRIHELLSDYIKTDDYQYHGYFKQRRNQMDSIMNFLPSCGGFRLI